MDSTLLKDERSRRKKKFRKKHLKPNEGIKHLCNPKEEKGKKQHILEKKKILMLQKRKNQRDISRVKSNTAKTDCSKVNSVAGIKSRAKHVSETGISIPSKAQRKLKRLKEKIITKNNAPMKNNYSDCIASKNIDGKRKRLHSDATFSSVKNAKTLKRKKCMSHDSPEIFDKIKTIGTDNFKNKNENDDGINSVFLEKTQTENLNESDSEEDFKIRNELKSLSFFKNIKRLVKDNPSLMANFNEEESFETESLGSLSESSIECEDNATSDDESKILPTDLFIPTTTKKKIDIPELEKGFDRTQKKSWDSKNEKVSATTSSCDFDRTKKNSLANKDRKIVSKGVTSTLRNKALEKLQGAKFRYLNEKLYTESGKNSFDYFQKNRNEYMDYHKGYSLQVAKWPLNPVDKIISTLQKMKKNITIADMGCGDAKIARTLSNCSVHSFDLVALNDFVTPCNISKVPLSNESVDVVIFCLSLMGTNLKEYLQEAYRIAKFGGILKIAEVESRIPNLDQFIKSIQSLGFSIEKKDVEHKLFVFLEFKKMKKKKKGAKVQDITLKPCLYKKR